MNLDKISAIRSTLVASIGVFVIWEAMRFNIGTPRQMGPGFFPAVVGGLLLFMSILLLFEGREDDIENSDKPFHLDWRPFVFIVLGIVSFALIINRFGLIPSVFVVVFLSSVGDRDNRIFSILCVSILFCIFAAIVFYYGLGLPFPLIRWY